MLSGLTKLYNLPFNVFMNVIKELLISANTEISLPEIKRLIFHLARCQIGLTFISKLLNGVILIIRDFNTRVFVLDF